MAHLHSRLEKLAHGVQKVGHPWLSSIVLYLSVKYNFFVIEAIFVPYKQ